MDSPKFAVLGSGGWGTAVALLLAQNPQHRVTLWSARPEHAVELHAQRENVHYLPGVRIPSQIHLTFDLAEAAADAALLIVAVPTQYLRPTFTGVGSKLPPNVPMLSLTKGLEIATFRRPTEILRELCGPRPLAVLSGPSHAEEVAHGLPASLVAASEDLPLARWVQQRFTTDRFRVYTNLDIVGVELAGALKNIIGIAAGICDGLGFGDNSKSALLTRGLAEMTRFGVAMGGENATFAGLAGMGDLITTCISRHGRNRQVGLRLAAGETPAQILATMTQVAEGVFTAKAVHEKAAKMSLPMPITAEVYRVWYEGKNPKTAVHDLMMREPKPEA